VAGGGGGVGGALCVLHGGIASYMKGGHLGNEDVQGVGSTTCAI
jgi:hypothetical protein